MTLDQPPAREVRAVPNPGAALRPTPAAGPLERVAAGSFLLYALSLPVAIAPMNIAGGLCVALTLSVWLTRQGAHRVRTPLDFPALAWLAAMGLSTLFAIDPAGSAENLGKGLIPFAAGVAAWHAAERRRGAAAVTALLAAGSVASLIGVAGFLATGGHFPVARAIGLTGTWMTFSLQLLLLASLACGVAITARRRAWRLGALAAALLCALGVVTSFTRSAWIGLAVSVGVMLGLRRPRYLIVLGVLAAVAFAALPGEFGDRLRSAFDPSHPGNLERTHMWDAGVRVFRDHPVTGVGLQNLTSLVQRYNSPAAIERPAHVHSAYLQVAVSTGVVGCFAFLLLCFGLLRTSAPGAPDLRRASGLGVGVRLGVTGGIIGFLLAALFDHPFGDEQLLFLLFVLAGIAWAARGWDRRIADAPDSSSPSGGESGPVAA